MKFTDGNWMLQPGVQAFYPAEARDVEVAGDTLTISATRPIRQRGDTLAGPLLTVELASPLADVIRVKLNHFAGELPKKPAFALQPQGAIDVTITSDAQAATLTSGALAVRVARGAPWRVEFLAEGRVVTASPARGMGIITMDDGRHFMHEQLALGVGEQVYGLGERFTAFAKNGQVIDMWNRDGGTGSDQAYKNVPFYMTNRGYGVFVNQPEQVEFEVASEKVSRVQFSVAGHSLEYLVIYGPSPKAILEKYTALTGRPPLPPAWSFGLWLTTSFTTSYDEATVTSFIQGMADRALPLHVFHFDCFWMREFNWCDFVWDPRVFPDPAGMLQRLKARGLHISVWINPYIGQRSPLFAEAARAGFLIKRPNGDVWQWDLWQPGMAIVDFTNPAACDWYAAKLAALLDMGVDCFKTDFGERIPTDVVYFDRSDPQRMHNYYAQLYNQVVFELLRAKRGEGEAVVFARSATAGGQLFPVHWGGDCDSTFPSMAESLRGGLSLGLSGFGFWSHDIGGFEGLPDAALYKRWIAFGLLSSHSRLHGSSSYRVPWLFDDEAVDVLRFFTELKCRLMPYIYAQAREATRSGVPVMRAMLLEFPADPTCDHLDRQYMLGEALLVAPVFSAEGSVTYYLPEGDWTSFASGARVSGGRWLRETHDMLSIPLLVRPHTVLAIGSDRSRPDYDYANGVTLHVYELAEDQPITTPILALSGEAVSSFITQRSANTIIIERHGRAQPWQIQLTHAAGTPRAEGCQLTTNGQGTLVTPAPDADRIVITL